MPPIQPPRRAKLRFKGLHTHANVIIKHMYQPGTHLKSYRVPPPFTPPASYAAGGFCLSSRPFRRSPRLRQRDPGRFAQRRVYALYLDITDNVKTGQTMSSPYRSIQKTIRKCPARQREHGFYGVRRDCPSCQSHRGRPLHVNWTFVSTQNPAQAAPTNPRCPRRPSLSTITPYRRAARS